MTDATETNTATEQPKAKKARKAPAKKTKKAAKKTAKKSNAGRKVTHPDTAKIKILSDGNPARANTNAHTMFAALKNGMTVGAYVEKCAAKEWDGRGNLRYWENQGHIKIS